MATGKNAYKQLAELPEFAFVMTYIHASIKVLFERPHEMFFVIFNKCRLGLRSSDF